MNDTVRKLTDAIGELDLDELRAEEAQLERALAFVRGARIGLERLEATGSIDEATDRRVEVRHEGLPPAIADVLNVARKFGLRVTSSPSVEFATPRETWAERERIMLAGLRQAFHEAPDLAEELTTPPADAAGIARQEQAVAERLAERDDAPPADNPAVAEAIARRNEEELDRQRQAPDLAEAVEAREFVSPLDLLKAHEDVTPAPSIVAGVDLAGLPAKRAELVELYADLGFNVLQARAEAGELDHELDRRLADARDNQQAAEEAAAVRPEEDTPTDPPAAASTTATDDETPPAVEAPPEPDAPAEPTTRKDRLLEHYRAFPGVWIGSSAACEAINVDKTGVRAELDELVDEGKLTHNGKGGAASKFAARLDDGIDDDARSDPGDPPADVPPDGMTPSEYARTVRAEGAIDGTVSANDAGRMIRGLLNAEEAAAAIREQDAPPAAPVALKAKPKASPARSDTKPTQDSLEGRILGSLSYKAGTARELVARLGDVDGAEVLTTIAKLVDEGELMRAGKTDGRTVYAASRPALV